MRRWTQDIEDTLGMSVQGARDWQSVESYAGSEESDIPLGTCFVKKKITMFKTGLISTA